MFIKITVGGLLSNCLNDLTEILLDNHDDNALSIKPQWTRFQFMISN